MFFIVYCFYLHHTILVHFPYFCVEVLVVEHKVLDNQVVV